jgi:hypothetical protein
MNRKVVILTSILFMATIVTSVVLAANWFSNQTVPPEFYLGVEYAYGDSVDEVKALVDKVKDYTNLILIGSIELTFNRSALDEACDYIYEANLNLIVQFTSSTMYDYDIFDWMVEAEKKYGETLLGIYRYDEPGGNQLDRAAHMLIESGESYSEVAENYTSNLRSIVEYYLDYAPQVFTGDYGLYWFNYKSSYSAVLVEYGWNHSRELHTALCRGAASAHNRDWGVIVTWTYEQPPYLQSGIELYDDLRSAWIAGAKYAVVFSYPSIGPYGTLMEEHFDALRNFWNYMHQNPGTYGKEKARAVYVLPRDYGFGFRNPADSIWGLFSADELSAKIWDDANRLTATYGFNLDIVYDEPVITGDLQDRYETIYYWNQSIT